MVFLKVTFMRLFRRLRYLLGRLYWHYLASPEKEARHLGVSCGVNCLIATRNWSSEPYLITIGNNCQITDNVHFYTHGGGQAIREIDPSFDCFGKIKVDDYAYIGSNSLILPGVTIGKGALVAAGSVVTKSVAPHSVVGGNPAKFICTTQEYYERNKAFNIKTKGKSNKEKEIILKSLDEKLFIKK